MERVRVYSTAAGSQRWASALSERSSKTALSACRAAKHGVGTVGTAATTSKSTGEKMKTSPVQDMLKT